MNVKRDHFHNLRELPSDEFLMPGSLLCAGCGGLATLRLFHKVLGGNVVVVNAAGCLTLLAVFPFSPLRSSWLFTDMGGASAGAQGIRDALDLLIEQHRIPDSENLHVVVVAGDGSSYEMGLAATSAALHRRLNFWYLCYDNEAYGNTGFQTSAASPSGSRTSTPTAVRPGKMDLFSLWSTHHPPLVATISSHHPLDLAEKVHRAAQLTGPRLFIALAACPPGWGFDPRLADEIAGLALETGVWPLKESVHGQTRHTYLPDHRLPVEEYLRPQRRFQHLFVPQRDNRAIEAIQAAVDAYWAGVPECAAQGASEAGALSTR